MSARESQIDDLYRAPLDEFISKRRTLALSLGGEDRKTVAGLHKPTALVWAVNQTYWRAKPLYDEVLKTGKALRTAQIASLRGRSVDVRSAANAHRDAVSKAVTAAGRLAEASGLNPPTDGLQRMFEAMSTRETLPERHGRFSKPLTPTGFEALAGVSIAAPRTSSLSAVKAPNQKERLRAQKQEEAERRKHAAAIEKAQAIVDRAAADEQHARAAWERARKALEDAKQRLTELE